MNEKVIFGIVITIFLGLLSAVHYYVFAKASLAFGIERTLLYYYVMIIFVMSYLIANLFMVANDNAFTRILYFGASAWLGMVFFLFCFFLVSDILSIFYVFDASIAGLLVLLASFILLIYGIINASSLHVKKISFTSKKLLHPIKIVQMSDIHLGPVFDIEYLGHIVNLTNEQKPDLVLITGDLFDGPYKYDSSQLKILNNIDAPIYFSTGNHEGYVGMPKVYEALKDVELKFLRNETIAIEVNNNKIGLTGIDDAESRHQVKDEIAKLSLNQSIFNILMYHRPNGYKDAASKADLMLAGHTHDGQIWPLTYFVPIFSYPINGLHSVKEFSLFISTGAGGWGPPIRLGSYNEIVNITLNPANQ